MIAALWGIVVFKEFNAAPGSAWLLLLLMFVAYCGACVVFVCASGKM